MKIRKLCGMILAFLCSLMLAGTVKLSASAEYYEYSVRFFAGKQGTLTDIIKDVRSSSADVRISLSPDGELLTVEGLNYGDRVTFDRSIVELNDDSKYYVKGIRESGKDNNTVSAYSFEVRGDQDYVVAYGLLGSAVAYTVNYVDASGNVLAEPEIYYGNVGDKPVVAFRYLDGYEPQAYNLTKTLVENAAENVFTFVYNRIVLPQAGPGVDVEIPGGGNQGTVIEEVVRDLINEGGNDVINDAEGGNAGAGDDAGTGGGAGAPENENPSDDQTPQGAPEGEGEEQGPQEIIDLDDGQVPLADGDGVQEDPPLAGATLLGFGPNTWLVIVAICAAAAALICFMLYAGRKRKKRDE